MAAPARGASQLLWSSMGPFPSDRTGEHPPGVNETNSVFTQTFAPSKPQELRSQQGDGIEKGSLYPKSEPLFHAGSQQNPSP